MITSDQTWRNTKLQEWVGYYDDIIPKDRCENFISLAKQG